MRRPLAVVCVALAAPALVAAAGNPVVAATKRTAAAKSATFQMSTATAVGGQRMAMFGTGAQKGAAAKLSLRMRVQGTTIRFDTVMLQEQGRYVMYMRSPLFQAQLPAGKSWVRVDLSKQTASAGLDLGSLFNAAQSYMPLQRGLVSTTFVGREPVAGRSAARYRVVVDVERAARALPAYGKQVQAIERATGIRLGRIPYDVWVADGRLRRVRFSMPTAAGSVRGNATVAITFVSYDRPVRITAPPRAQVFTP